MLLSTASMALLLAVQTASDPAATAPATDAASASASGTPAAAGVRKVAGKPRMICEDIQEIGSRLSKGRVCHTSEEWKRIRASDRLDIDRMQSGRRPG